MDTTAITRAMTVLEAEQRWQSREIRAMRDRAAEAVATTARELKAYDRAFEQDRPLPRMTFSKPEYDAASYQSLVLIELDLYANLLVMRDCNRELGEQSPYWNDPLWRSIGDYADEDAYHKALAKLAPPARSSSHPRRAATPSSTGSAGSRGWPVRSLESEIGNRESAEGDGQPAVEVRQPAVGNGQSEGDNRRQEPRPEGRGSPRNTATIPNTIKAPPANLYAAFETAEQEPGAQATGSPTSQSDATPVESALDPTPAPTGPGVTAQTTPDTPVRSTRARRSPHAFRGRATPTDRRHRTHRPWISIQRALYLCAQQTAAAPTRPQAPYTHHTQTLRKTGPGGACLPTAA